MSDLDCAGRASKTLIADLVIAHAIDVVVVVGNRYLSIERVRYTRDSLVRIVRECQLITVPVTHPAYLVLIDSEPGAITQHHVSISWILSFFITRVESVKNIEIGNKGRSRTIRRDENLPPIER